MRLLKKFDYFESYFFISVDLPFVCLILELLYLKDKDGHLRTVGKDLLMLLFCMI